MLNKQTRLAWIGRATLGFVSATNLSCALVFLLYPEQYASGFELTGLPGRTAVQGFAILFLMWNATYPPVLRDPVRQQTLFGVILLQQIIGVAGETWLWLSLPAGHPALYSTGLRFIILDGLGLFLMGGTYFLLWTVVWKPTDNFKTN